MRIMRRLWIFALCSVVLLFGLGAADRLGRRGTAGPLTLTFPDPLRAESVLLVSGDTVALIDPSEEDEDRIAALFRNRKIRKIDVLILTGSGKARDRYAGVPVARTFPMSGESAGAELRLGDATVRMDCEDGAAHLIVEHGENRIPVTPPDRAASTSKGSMVIRSDGKYLRLQPEGMRSGT